MCDYSLAEYRSRLAVAGEELTTYVFPSGTRGFSTPVDVAERRCVCIPPGAQLSVTVLDAAIRAALQLTCAGPHLVTFGQAGMYSCSHRDALTFSNDRVILLHHVGNLRATVLALEPAPEPEPVPVSTQPKSWGERLREALASR